MAKYTMQFKLEVVQRYQAEGIGFKSLGRLYGIDGAMVKRWIHLYQAHGESGLVKKFTGYGVEEKLAILQRMWDEEWSYTQTIAAFNIRSMASLRSWERCYHSGGIEALKPRARGRPKKMPESLPPDTQRSTDDETRTREELLAEVNHLRMEVAYLKKLPSLSSATAACTYKPAQKAQVVDELRQQFPLADLLQLAGLARSTFYYQQKVALATDKHQALKQKIQTIFARHKGRYGYRRITSEIRKLGQQVNHKTVQRQMFQLGLKSLVRPKKYRSYRGDVGQAADNVLQRQFTAKTANQKWVTDVTEFNVAGEKLYLSPVMDLYNGEIIAFETAKRPAFKLVSGMLQKALSKLKASEKPMVHSDQGWQYRMPAYQRTLQERGLTQSMSRKGNCLDNAPMESFFAVLKSEFFYLNQFGSIDELQAGLKRYIHYYNHDRIKLKLKGLSPVQYRTQPLAA
ncbi:IS3 family transposase [Pseudoduganella danionis]|uniref:IS3 family transposase n=2 Tax=Pseudoduganella danionis TaxID=1890295 RepID=UPI0036069D79